MKKFISLFICLVLGAAVLCAAENENTSFMKTKPKITNKTEFGDGDAEIEWGGRNMTVDDIHKNYGKAGTRRMWTSLDDKQKFALTKAYSDEGFWWTANIVGRGIPKKEYMEKHFTPGTIEDMRKIYRKNTLGYRGAEKNSKSKLDAMISSNVKFANEDKFIDVPASYMDMDLTKDEKYELASAQLYYLKRKKEDLANLQRMFVDLEIDKIGTAISSGAQLVFEQVVDFVTGGVYSATAEFTDLIANIAMTVYGMIKTAINSGTGPDTVIKLKTDIQNQYLAEMEIIASNYVNLKAEYDAEIAGLMDRAKKNYDNKIKEKADRLVFDQMRREEELNSKLNESIPEIKPEVDPEDDKEAKKRKLKKAVNKKLDEIWEKIKEEDKAAQRQTKASYNEFRKKIGMLNYEIKKEKGSYYIQGAPTGVSYVHRAIELSQNTKIEDLVFLKRKIEDNLTKIPPYKDIFNSYKIKFEVPVNQHAVLIGYQYGQIRGLYKKYTDLISVSTSDEMPLDYKKRQLKPKVSENGALKQMDSYKSMCINAAMSCDELNKAMIERMGTISKLISDKKEIFEEEIDKYEKALGEFNSAVFSQNVHLAFYNDRLKELNEEGAKVTNKNLNKNIYGYNHMGAGFTTDKWQEQVWIALDEGTYASASAAIDTIIAKVIEQAGLWQIVENSRIKCISKLEEYKAAGSTPEMREVYFAVKVGAITDEIKQESPRKLQEKIFESERKATLPNPHKTKSLETGYMVISILQTFNSEVYSAIKNDKGKMRSLVSGIDVENAVKMPTEEFGKMWKELSMQAGELGLSRFREEMLEINEEIVPYNKNYKGPNWRPYLGADLSSGKRVFIYKIYSDKVTKEDQALREIYSAFMGGKGKEILERRGKSSTETTQPPAKPDGMEVQVKELYNRFAKNYKKGNVNGIMACMDQKWSSTDGEMDYYDLEEHLEDISSVFRKFNITITNLRISTDKSGKYDAIAKYDINISAELIKRPDAVHEEKSSVTDYLIEKNRKFYIKSTEGTNFSIGE